LRRQLQRVCLQCRQRAIGQAVRVSIPANPVFTGFAVGAIA
jgi:hypothetical protein